MSHEIQINLKETHSVFLAFQKSDFKLYLKRNIPTKKSDWTYMCNLQLVQTETCGPFTE
jgi:hypothetical protein